VPRRKSLTLKAGVLVAMSGDYAAVLTRSVGVSRERLVSNEVQIVLENEFDLTLRPSTNQFRTNVTTGPTGPNGVTQLWCAPPAPSPAQTPGGHRVFGFDLKRAFVASMLEWIDAGWQLGEFNSPCAHFFCTNVVDPRRSRFRPLIRGSSTTLPLYPLEWSLNECA